MVHERDNTMAGLIRKSLGTNASAGEARACPDAGVLAAYYERLLDREEMAMCESHVSGCGVCRERLATMVRAEEDVQSAASHAWLWDWRLVTAAVAALLVITVWSIRQAMAPVGSHTANEPLVAMSRNEEPPKTQVEREATGSPVTPSLVAPPEAGTGGRAEQEVAGEVSPRAKMAAPAAAEPSSALKKEAAEMPGADVSAGAPQKLDQVTPTQAAPPQLSQNEPAERSLNGRDARGLDALQPAPEAKTSAPASRMAAANAAQRLAAPSAAAAGVAAPMTSAEATNKDASGANRGVPGANAPAMNARSFSATAGSAEAAPQIGEQRSSQTIIRTSDPKVLWRIAGGGFIERSQDGGASWNGQLIESNVKLTTGAAPTSKACWVVGENGAIYVTKDAVHWKKIAPPIPADFVSVEAQSASSAIVRASGGQKFSTSDGGKKWLPAQ